ncbi:tryptophan--tRNA ligase [Amphiplicatus metriothermophilus]|uniref:Tryptophan--tRNA ligase n=1 Tax=Amphiplicatus metriothermophilus TaxID=1519374 RepID=A0A239PKZ9_9PROT|nr:tryptophan--tRNA ligase [Amphiplicatus metriothermophilus]MBB5517410.1 tryptophanyl-tRNA synthetase [Amphiplicatus metriothermophilus]SNT68255.1 tryptophanyl-tRNA synthetase [Amphiplicatus metriothermophilus]
MTGYKGPERVLSGIQTSGNMHLGNYLGAIRKFVALQREHDCFFFLADMHAITVWQEPEKLRAQTWHIAATYLAAGIDPEIATIFPQSAVPAHAELAWIFNCVARLGWLDRMTQFKDKAGKDKERASVGLYTYPVLQAADILVYKATRVPVGEDQKQHLELSRDIAAKFNHDYGVPDFFPLPEPLIKGPGARVMSLRDGTKKMSKSDPSENACIFLKDDADAIARKIRKAVTDPEPLPSEVKGLEGRPEAANLVGIYAALAGTDDQAVLDEFGGKGFSVFKPALAELATEKIAPIGAEIRRLEADPAHLEAVLARGAERAAAIADPVVREVKKIVGFAG